MKQLHWLGAVLLLLALTPATLPAQQPATIVGRVTSETGAPLGSASVFVPTLNLGTLTRADGTFILIVPAGRVTAGQSLPLTAQIVGHRAQTQTVTPTLGGSVTVNFQLATDVLQLEGIVATGIGQAVARERLGVSISTVTGAEIAQVQSPNVVAALAAKAPGVEITSSSGEPGASAYIRIRGINTLVGTGQPLFVVDGVPIDNSTTRAGGNDPFFALRGAVGTNRASDINPQDIESIEILKGAAAAAIYGARAANGVVLVTTRRGLGGVTRATLTTTATVDQVTGGVPLQRRFGQGSQGIAPDGTPGNTANDRFTSWGPELPAGVETFDHWGGLFRTGHQFDNNLSISGGTERTSYYLSLGRLTHDGTIVGPNNRFERTTARLKGSHQLTEQLSIGGNFAYAETDGSYVQRGSTASGLLLGSLRSPPEFDNRVFMTEPTSAFPRGLHRSYRNPNPTAINQSRGFDNPYFVLNEQRNTGQSGRMYGNIALDYTPAHWLTLNYTLGNDYVNEQRLNVWPQMSTTRALGRMTVGQYINQQIDHNAVATLRHTLTDLVGGSLVVGWNRNQRRFDQLEFQGDDFVAPGIYNMNNTVTRFPNEFQSRVHSESFFGQASLDLYEQLFLTAALRNDGFSTFGESERRHWYPKASAAWEFTRTLGMTRGAHPILSFGKLRAAWGQAGNEPPVYGTITTFTALNIGDGGWNPALNPTYAGRGGLYSANVQGQEELRPERTREFEAGLDLSLLRDLAGVQLTYYNALTTDAIFNAQVAPSTGYFFQLQNAATIRNRGIEVDLNLRPVQTPGFAWEAGITFGRNDNRVLDLGDPDREFVSYTNATSFGGVSVAAVRGERIGVFRGNDWYRCGRAGETLPEDIATACVGAPAGAVYIGETGEPVVDPRQRTIADPHPDWTAGIRNSITLMRNVTVTTLVDIKQGGDMWNGTRASLLAYGTHTDTEDRGVITTFAQRSGEAVVGPGRNTEMEFGEEWYLGQGGGFGDATAQFIEDASYVKLREIAVNYTLSPAISQRLGMSAIDLRLAGRNLHTWTSYTGQDPETNLAGATNARGYDFFNNPQTRSFIITVGLSR